AEDGIRDPLVTGVQTCALPICLPGARRFPSVHAGLVGGLLPAQGAPGAAGTVLGGLQVGGVVPHAAAEGGTRFGCFGGHGVQSSLPWSWAISAPSSNSQSISKSCQADPSLPRQY